MDSLFTNIPPEETITFAQSLNKSGFKEFLSLGTKESYFLFNEILYKQTDGVAMGSPLGPTLANAFPCFYEKSG